MKERQLAVIVGWYAGWYALRAVLKELVPETPYQCDHLSADCSSCIKQLTDAQHTQLCDLQHNEKRKSIVSIFAQNGMPTFDVKLYCTIISMCCGGVQLDIDL